MMYEVCVNLLQMIRSIDRLSETETFPQQWNLKHRSYLMMISFSLFDWLSLKVKATIKYIALDWHFKI